MGFWATFCCRFWMKLLCLCHEFNITWYRCMYDMWTSKTPWPPELHFLWYCVFTFECTCVWKLWVNLWPKVLHKPGEEINQHMVHLHDKKFRLSRVSRFFDWLPVNYLFLNNKSKTKTKLRIHMRQNVVEKLFVLQLLHQFYLQFFVLIPLEQVFGTLNCT